MGETQPSSAYREKAAKLRAAADATTNAALKYELLLLADDYDKLADRADKQRPKI